jgi:predicted nucleic-acid-binding protein
MYFADTNIFIRYFTQDDPIKAKAVQKLIKKVQTKEVELTISEVILVEIVQVLSSKVLYALPSDEVVKRLRPLLALENLKIEHKKVYLTALDLYQQHNIDFADCILAAKSFKYDSSLIYSYDRDFDKIEGVTRIEA